MIRYIFKAARKDVDKRERNAWKRVSIPEDKTLWDLDQALREKFGYDRDDHLSQYTFFDYRYLVAPDINMDCGSMELRKFPLKVGQKIQWVWDLGACWEHVVKFDGGFTESAKCESLL